LNRPADVGPLLGRVETRVRYPETDRMGVAYHGHYLVWFELGRTEWMREIGFPYGELEDEGVYFPVTRAEVRYRRSARYDERLVVETRLVSVGASRVRFEYQIDGQDGRMVATGATEHGAVGPEGRPRRLPANLRERLQHGGS